MTVEKTTRFQSELNSLFKKFNIASGGCLFIHAGTLHVVESHVTEKNPLIVELMDGLTEALKQIPDVPIQEHWSNTKQ